MSNGYFGYRIAKLSRRLSVTTSLEEIAAIAEEAKRMIGQDLSVHELVAFCNLSGRCAGWIACFRNVKTNTRVFSSDSSLSEKGSVE